MPTDTSDHDLLIRLETKVDAFISSQSDHEVRLRLLEKAAEQQNGSVQGISNTWKWIISGFGVVVGLVDPAIMLIVGMHK